MASLLLSHHPPEEADRCLRLAGQHVCRRCVLLWPLTYLLLGIQVALRLPADHLMDVALPVLIAPAALEYTAVYLEFWQYRASRLWVLTPLLAVGLARLSYRYMANPLDPWAWSIAVVAGLPCAYAAWRHLAK